MNFGAGKAARGLRTRRAATVVIVFLVSLLALAAIRQWRVRANAQTRPSLLLTSSSFPNGGAIPRRLTCDGAGISPSLAWQTPPPGTKSLALVVHDPYAPSYFTHWLAYGIPASVHALAEGASTNNAMPPGSAEGVNGFRRLGYSGPCPPPGKPHRYIFQVYALDVNVSLLPGATRGELEAAMRGHILAEGRMVGVYRRGGSERGAIPSPGTAIVRFMLPPPHLRQGNARRGAFWALRRA